MFRKSQPNFQHYVKKVEAQAKKKVFVSKKRVVIPFIMDFCAREQLW